MNKLLHNKSEITLVATCSNMKGCIVNKESSDTNESTEDEKNITNNKYSCDNKRIFIHICNWFF